MGMSAELLGGGYRKVALIGTGLVGMSMAYNLINKKGIDELVLIDAIGEHADGEAMDLRACQPFAEGRMQVYSGDYSDCGDANVIVVCSGSSQEPGMEIFELAALNARIAKNVGKAVKQSGFNGVIIVATAPVDAMTYAIRKVTGLPTFQVFGIGTMLETARLRYQIGEFLEMSPESIQAYILGEAGDSSFVSWTNCYVGNKLLLELVEEKQVPFEYLQSMYEVARESYYEIIQKKGENYYGIGMALARLVEAVLNNENVILPVSCYQEGQYGYEGLYTSVPAVINRGGIREILKLHLTASDVEKFDVSVGRIRNLIEGIVDPILDGK